MGIMTFIRSLSPKLTRSQVMDSLNNVREELETGVLPSYKKFNDLFSRYDVQDKDLKVLQSALQQRLHSKDSLTVMIEDHLQASLATLLVIERVVNSQFAESVYKEAISYFQANILQYISIASFVTRYARNLLTLVMVREAEAHGEKSRVKLPNAELARMKDNQKAFVNSLPLVSLDKEQLERRISKIPRAFVTEDNASIAEKDINTYDPLRMNFMDTKLNPLFLFGAMKAEWDATNYRELKEEIAAQESLLTNLQLTQARQKDPKLEQRAERELETLTKLRQKLDEKERLYGLKQ